MLHDRFYVRFSKAEAASLSTGLRKAYQLIMYLDPSAKPPFLFSPGMTDSKIGRLNSQYCIFALLSPPSILGLSRRTFMISGAV